MRLFDMTIDSSLDELFEALFENEVEGSKPQNNRIVASWAKKIGWTYDELYKVWEDSVQAAGGVDGKYGYGGIVEIFKRKLTSVTGITKKQLADGGKGDFSSYKIRTSQSKEQLLSDEVRPKSTNKAAAKKAKAAISKINSQMREIRAKPNNTPKQKERNKKLLNDLKAKKKTINDSLKEPIKK